MGNAKDVAWSYFDALGEGRVDDALDILDPEGTFWSVVFPRETPIQELYDHIRASIDATHMTFELHNAVEQGDTVMLELESHGEAPNGDPYNNVYAFIVTVRNGKVLRLRGYTDARVVDDLIEAVPEGQFVHWSVD